MRTSTSSIWFVLLLILVTKNEETDNAANEQDVDLHTQLMESHGNLMTEAQDLRRRNRELEAASLESEQELRHATEQVFFFYFHFISIYFAGWRPLPSKVSRQVFMAKENSKQKKRREEVPLSAYL